MAKLRLSKATGKRAAVYLRKSTDAQEASIPGQRKAVHEYALRHGYEIVAEFVDSGISGVDSSVDRREFQRLILAAERHEFDFVVAWDMSRITRSDPMETMAELRPLKKTGVKIATTDRSEPVDWDSFAGILMLSVEAESNNQYVRKLARGTTRGQVDLARQGLWVAGRPPIGFRVGKDKRLKLGPQSEVAAVQWAFQAYADGHSFRGVQAGLKERGFPMVVSSVKWMLSNRLYVGDFAWGRNTQAKFYSVRNGEISTDFERGQTDESEQIIVANSHPAIVDRELYDRIQGMFANRKRASTPHKSGGSFALTGLLRCADCGYGMIGGRNTTAKAKNVLYRCGGYLTKGVEFCHPHIVQQDEVLAAVFSGLQHRFNNPETVERIKKAAREQLATATKKAVPAEIESELRREKAKLEKASRRLVEVDTDLLDVVQQQVRSVKAKITQLEKDLRQCSVTVSDVMHDIDARAEQAAAMFNQFSEIYRTADATKIRGFLLEIIDHITVDVSRSNASGRWRYTFETGEIVLKQNVDLFDSWSKGKQVLRLRLKATA